MPRVIHGCILSKHLSDEFTSAGGRQGKSYSFPVFSWFRVQTLLTRLKNEDQKFYGGQVERETPYDTPTLPCLGQMCVCVCVLGMSGFGYFPPKLRVFKFVWLRNYQANNWKQVLRQIVLFLLIMEVFNIQIVWIVSFLTSMTDFSLATLVCVIAATLSHLH